MKLLTILAAFLLSFSAFSQDIIEYNQGTFSRNGEELSIEQIEKLTEDQSGWYAQLLLFDGKRANRRANNRLFRNSVAIITAGMGGISSYGLILTGDLARDLELRQLQISFYGLGVAMIPSTIFLAIHFSRQDYWMNQRDDCFIRLAEKINQAAMKSEKSQ